MVNLAYRQSRSVPEDASDGGNESWYRLTDASSDDDNDDGSMSEEELRVQDILRTRAFLHRQWTGSCDCEDASGPSDDASGLV